MAYCMWLNVQSTLQSVDKAFGSPLVPWIWGIHIQQNIGRRKARAHRGPLSWLFSGQKNNKNYHQITFLLSCVHVFAPKSSPVAVSSVINKTGLDPHYMNAHEKSIAKKLKMLRQIRDHIQKALGEENSDLLGLFLGDPFLTSFFKIAFKIRPEQK